MSNCAKVSLTGRLTKEPVSKPWQGTSVVSFSMAVNTTKKDEKTGKYLADFYNVSAWGKVGEFILPKIQKGSLVQVYGDLVLQTYKDKNNIERQSLSVRATDIVPLSPKREAEAQPDNDGEPDPF